jgi:hypothetical protein
MRPLLVVASLAASLAIAQRPVSAQPFDEPVRGYVGGDLLLASPVGEFADNVGTGFGVAGFGRYELDRDGVISLRIDGGFMTYGRETIRICVTLPCRVTGDLTTSNNIAFAGIGPELGTGPGVVRAYLNGNVGFTYFGTTSEVEGSDNDGDAFASSTNFDDVTFAWTVGSGIQFRVSSGRHPVYIDLGVRYHGNGEAEYLRKGDIVDLPDGSVDIRPQRSETNLWTIGIGASVGIPRGEG